MYKKHSPLAVHTFVFVASLLFACSSESQLSAAPVGEKSALEQLASAYNGISEQLPVDPSSLPANSRKKFVQQVFSAAGYDYNKTLAALADVSAVAVNQYHKDMVELLLLPHRGLAKEEVAALYSNEELILINKIQQMPN